MEIVFALATGLQKLGAIGAVGAAVAMFALPTRRGRALAMTLALILTPVLLIATIYSSEQLSSFRGHAVALAVAAVVGVALIGALAYAIGRWPELFPLLAVAALPFRIPIAFGGTSANLLVPLYLVVAAGGIAHVVGHLRRGGAHGTDEEPIEGRRGWLELVLMGFVGLYAVQSLYSADFAKALDQVVFFLVPFALLLFLLLRVRWTARLTAACLGVIVAEALVFAGIGFGEYATRHLFWNPKVIDANQFASYFRVNSVFYDPNVYGRFLAIVMTALTAVVLWQVRRSSRLVLFVAALAVLWAGLVLTFSQSSFGALLVGLAVLAALRWSTKWTLVSAATLGIVAAIAATLFASAIHLRAGRVSSLNTATSGRVKLIGGGMELFANRPIWGFGSGSFNRMYEQERKAGARTAVSASHTTPVTIAAEQGILGLAGYVLLLYFAFTVMLGGIRGPPASSAVAPGAGYVAARAAVAAAFCGIVFHTLVYAAFLEDPFLWAVLGIGAGLARQGAFVDKPGV